MRLGKGGDDNSEKCHVDRMLGTFESVTEKRRSVMSLRRFERLELANDVSAGVENVGVVTRTRLRHRQSEPGVDNLKPHFLCR